MFRFSIPKVKLAKLREWKPDDSENVVHYLRVQVPGEEKTREYLLDRSVDAAGVAIGTDASVTVEDNLAGEIRTNRAGESYIGYSGKQRIVAIEKAAA